MVKQFSVRHYVVISCFMGSKKGKIINAITFCVVFFLFPLCFSSWLAHKICEELRVIFAICTKVLSSFLRWLYSLLCSSTAQPYKNRSICRCHLFRNSQGWTCFDCYGPVSLFRGSQHSLWRLCRRKAGPCQDDRNLFVLLPFGRPHPLPTERWRP